MTKRSLFTDVDQHGDAERVQQEHRHHDADDNCENKEEEEEEKEEKTNGAFVDRLSSEKLKK